MYQEKIIDCESGQVTWRDYTDAENKKVEQAQVKAAQLQIQSEAKATVKAAAQAKLAALGLTVEDLQALGL